MRQPDPEAYNQIALSLARRYDSVYYVDIDTGNYMQYLDVMDVKKSDVPRYGEHFFEDAVKNAVESFQHLGEACKTLKSVLSHHKNEDNMDVIGILANAITQIVADDAGEDGEESSEGEEGGESVIDQIENEYSPMGGVENEEPAGEPSPVEPEEPEEF